MSSTICGVESIGACSLCAAANVARVTRILIGCIFGEASEKESLQKGMLFEDNLISAPDESLSIVKSPGLASVDRKDRTENEADHYDVTDLPFLLITLDFRINHHIKPPLVIRSERDKSDHDGFLQ